MTSRRNFLQAGVAVGAITMPGVAALADTAAAMRLHRVVFDSGSPWSAQFAAEARLRGAVLFDTRGDVTQLWLQQLLPVWRERPVALAGMTSYASLFALQTVAEDVRVRVVFRAHHLQQTDGSMRHELFGPTQWLAQQPPLPGATTRWTSAAARLLVRWPAELATVDSASSSIGRARQSNLTHQTMVSWIIAPLSHRARAA
jgi:hypothetical protein